MGNLVVEFVVGRMFFMILIDVPTCFNGRFVMFRYEIYLDILQSLEGS